VDTATQQALAQLATQQKAVTTAQSTVSASLTAAQDALTAQQAACEDAFSGGGSGDDGGTDPSADPSADPTADPSASASAGDGDVGGSDDAANQACTDALSAVQAAQQQVSTDQGTLQDALEDLAATLTKAAVGLQGSGSQTQQPSSGETEQPSGGQTQQPSGGQSQQPSGGSGESPSGPTGSSGGMTVSAATLAKDQAQIDQAKADLVTAQQELAMARVTAPFAGEVVAVDADPGDSVSSGTEVFVLVSRGTTTVEVDATSTQVQKLKVGQKATATPAGSEKARSGTVTQVSSVPDDSSTYPVTITLDRKHLDIATGLNASVAVVIGAAKDVVTVPASAVSDGSVTVLDGDTATRTRVTTGVTGATTVQVTDGVEEGDLVVLADLGQALPSSDNESQRRRTFGPGGGGFGGTGGPPGGGMMIQRGQ
jgi:multidrug efflux pump subunit AcrA (membrane-fusion protein)